MLKVTLVGEGEINNAVIFLEDPGEKLPHYLNPTTTDGKTWERDNINIPWDLDLDYSLYVQAFSGTRFECTIINKTDNTTINFSGVTGRIIKSHANIKGSDKFK